MVQNNLNFKQGQSHNRLDAQSPTDLDPQTEEALWEGSALRWLYEITSQPNLSFSDKVQRLLEMGCQQLGLKHGILAHVSGDAYEIVEIFSATEVLPDSVVQTYGAQNKVLQKGSVLLTANTYCERTLQSNEPISFTQAKESGWATHPAYQTFNLEAYIGVAVTVDKQTYGTLNLSNDTPRTHPFTHSESTLVRLMAQWIGRELEHQRAEATLALRAQELAALYETSLDINTQPDLSTLLQTIVQRATTLLGTHKGGLSLIRPESSILEVVAGHNRPDDSMNIRIALGEGLAGRIAQTGEPMMIADYKRWSGRAESLANRPIGRILGVPLKRRDQVIGVLNVFDEKTGTFTEDDVRLLSLFAAQATVALENARLFEANQRRTEQLEALRQQSLDLTMSHDLDGLLYQIVERAVTLLKGDSGGINLYRPESEVLERVAAVGSAAQSMGIRLVKGEGVAGQVWATGKPLFLDDYQRWGGRSPQIVDASGPIVGTPIQWGDEFLGALIIRRDQGQRVFTTEDAALLSQFATHAAIAIYNARLYKQAQQEIGERKRAQAQMHASLKQKEILLQEVNHRVKNNLQIISSLLRVQARSITDDQIRALFRESQSRVDAMSLIHERLYKSDDLANIDFGTYIEELAIYLIQSYEILAKVELDIKVDPIYLDLKAAIPCSLIINELVTNALKYAFPDRESGKIQIRLTLDSQNQALLIIKDDGVGLPANFDFQNTASLGLQLVALLTDQLGGELSFERSPGTEFRIRFAKD